MPTVGVSEAVQLLATSATPMSAGMIHRRIHDGTIPATVVGGCWRLARAWIDAQLHPPDPNGPPPPATDPLAGLPDRPLLSVVDLAGWLGFSERMLRDAMRRGEIPGVRIAGRWWAPRAKLVAWLTGDTNAA